MYTLNFKVNVVELERNIKNLYVKAIKDEQLREDMRIAQIDEIESRVKTRLATRIYKPHGSRDPNLTDSKNTGVIGKISNLITSGAKASGKRDAIISWTGDIRYMDENDPIFNANPARIISHDKVRLWRIMEAGTVKKGYKILPRHSSALYFFWKRHNKFVKKDQVIHPGITGRNYIFKNKSFLANKQIMYESDKGIIKRIFKAFNDFLKRHE